MFGNSNCVFLVLYLTHFSFSFMHFFLSFFLLFGACVYVCLLTTKTRTVFCMLPIKKVFPTFVAYFF